MVRDGDKLLASKEVTLAADGVGSSETMFFNAGDAGVKSVGFSLEPLAGEENALNNAVTRLVDVSAEKRRILYVEGEPRWEYKFIRRAEADDKGVQIVSMLRTTENKIYRQGIADPSELADGFPTQGGGPVQVPGDHYWERGGGVLYAGRSRSCCGSLWTSAAAGCCFWAGGFR